jgi:predicted RND superfamily exporter protein
MGLGLLFAYLFSIILVPVGFSLIKKVKRSERRDKMLHARVEWLRGLASFVIARRKAVLVIFAVVAVVAVLGTLRLKADYYYLGLFSEEMPLRQDYAAIDSVFKGTYSVEVLVKAQEEEGVKSPEILRKMAELQAHLESAHADLGTKTYSLVDVIREINQSLHQGDSAYYTLPETREEIAQALLLFELSGDDELEDLVTADYEEARVRVGVRNLPFSRYEHLFADIESYVAENFASGPDEPEITVTGLVPLWAAIHRYVGESQVRALIITAFIVLVVLMVMFRSVPLGLVMSVLNFFAVACTLGLMGWLEIPLDPYTILVAAIALGLLDDDSIHMLKHIQWEVAHGKSLEEAIRETFASVGQAMFYISAVLIAAFAVYGTSIITSLAKFGLLTAFTIVMGALVELILTPAVLVTLRSVLFPGARHESSPAEVGAAVATEP